jgi:hypothetical protein
MKKIEIQDLFDTLDYAERMERIAQTFLQWKQAMDARAMGATARLMRELHALAAEELRRVS